MNEPPIHVSEESANPKVRKRNWIGLIAVLILCTTAFILMRECKGIVETAVNAFKPTVNATTVVNSYLQLLTNQSKLVVLKSELAVEVTKEHEANWTVFRIPIPRGTTTVRLRAPGNKAQYFIPLADITKENFTFNESSRRLTFLSPAPILDEDVVDVQSDPGKLEIQTEVGWLRLDSRSGRFLRDQAQRELRQAVLREAGQAHYLKTAEYNAVDTLRGFLQPITSTVGTNISLVIELDNARKQ